MVHGSVTDRAEGAGRPTPKSDFRRRLLDGLAEAIRERGLQGAQIGDIVRNARTSNRTFYECFADKDEAFEALLDERGEELLAAVRAAADPTAPWDTQIDLMVDAYLAALAADRAFSVTVTRELPSLGARGVELQRRDVDRYACLLMEMTDSGSMREAGVVPVDEETATMLIGGIAEVLDRAIQAGRSPETGASTVKAVIKRVVAPN